MGHATFSMGDLTAVVGDNAAHEKHRSGYNGLWELRHAKSTRSVFVPGIAGLNLEHIFNGDDVPEREVYFEPRFSPMTFKKLSEVEAELHQPATPTFHLESWTRFKFVAPHYIDMTFSCEAHQHVFPRGWIGLFWASYMNAPLDKSMYFRGGTNGQENLWSQICTHAHNDESTVMRRNDKSKLEFAPGRESLYKSYSPMQYDQPFYYGNIDELTWILMFDETPGIRFTHSPSGGGRNSNSESTNPAWDFQWIISPYDVMKEYTVRIRVVLRPKCARKEVEAEFNGWRKTLP